MADSRNLVLQLLITAKNTAGDTINQIRTGISGIGSAVSESLAPLRSFGGLIAAALGVGSAKALQENADAYIRLTNSLRVATNSEEEFKTALNSVISIAERTNSNLETTASLYARIAQNAKAMNIAQSKVADLTELISKGMQLSGASAEEYASATLQLTQAFGSGVLRGEEFNAVMEASPELMRQLAKGLGVAIGELRGLAEQGVLSSGIVSQALLSQKDAIASSYANMTQTVEQAFTGLGNRITLFVGKLSETTGASVSAANSIKFLAQNLDVIAATMGGAVVAAIAKSGVALAGYVQQSFAAAAATKAQAIATAEQERAALASAAANVAAAQGTYNRALAEQRFTQQMIAAMEAELGYGVSETTLAEAKAKGAAAAQAATVATQRYAAAQAALNALQVESAAASGLFARAMGFLAGPGGLILLAVGAFSALLPMLRNNKTGTDELTASTDRYKESLAALNAVQLQSRANDLLTAISAQNKTLSEAKSKVDQLRDGHQNLWQVMRDGRPFAVQLTEAEAALAAEQQKLDQLQKNLRTTGDALNESKKTGVEIDGKTLVQYVQQGLAMDTLAKRISELAQNHKLVADATQNRITAELALAQSSGDLQRVESLSLDQAKKKSKAAQEQAGFDHAAAVAAQAKVTAMENEYKSYEQITPVQAKALIDAKADEAAKKAQAEASMALAAQLQYQTEHTLKLHAGSLLLLEVMAKEDDAATKNAAVKQTQIDSAIALAKAKGDEAKAAELLAEKSKLNIKDAQDEISRNKERVVELDKVINNLYAESQLKGMTTEQQKYIQGLMDEANERKRTIATIESKLPLMEQERKQAETMAGPIGDLIRLYEKSAAAKTAETAAIERSYAGKIRDLDTEIKIAEAKGDSAKASALKVEKAQAEADMEAALAVAKNKELDAEIALTEAKKLAISIDEQTTDAGRKKIAALDEEIAKLKAAQDANTAKAASAQADADAAKAAAEATKNAGDATATATAQTKEASKGLVQISKSMWDLTDAAKAWYDQQIKLGAGGQFAYLGDIKRGFDSAAASEKDAAAAAKELQAAWQEQQATGDINLGTLRALIDLTEQAAAVSSQYGYSVTKAGEEAIAELRSLEAQWKQVADTIESRNADLRAQLAELQGDKSRADSIRNETDLTKNQTEAELQLQQARATGDAAAIAAAEENLRLIRQIYEAKQAQIDQDERAAAIAARNKTSSSSSGGSSSSSGGGSSSSGGGLSGRSAGGGINLTVNTTGGFIDANFAEELARKLKPKLDEISRRSM